MDVAKASALLLVALMGAVALAGCHGPPSEGPDRLDAEAEREEGILDMPRLVESDCDEDVGLGSNGFRTLDQGMRSALNATRLLLRDQASYNETWMLHQSGRPSLCGVPAVDFTTEQVAVLVLGPRPPCHAAEVLGVEALGSNHRIEFVEESVLGTHCFYQYSTGTSWRPFHFVAVSRNATTVTFAEIYRTVARGHDSGIGEERRAVIEVEEDWVALWKEHTAGQGASEAPLVDFKTERVVAVFLGAKPDLCYGIRIVDIDVDTVAKKTAVGVRETVPGPESICFHAFGSPFHMIAIPNDGTEIVF